MRRIRFSLRVLILLVTATVLFLGFSQYRRREILKVCDELHKDKYAFHVQNELRDYIWQRKPIIGVIVTFSGKEAISTCKMYSDGEAYAMVTDPKEIERLKKTGMISQAK